MDLPQTNVTSRYAAPDATVAAATKLGLVLWIASTYWFKRQVYAKDRNLFNYALFGVGSLFSSMATSRFLIESPYAAAARRNNYSELRHQRQIGHFN